MNVGSARRHGWQMPDKRLDLCWETHTTSASTIPSSPHSEMPFVGVGKCGSGLLFDAAELPQAITRPEMSVSVRCERWQVASDGRESVGLCGGVTGTPGVQE